MDLYYPYQESIMKTFGNLYSNSTSSSREIMDSQLIESYYKKNQNQKQNNHYDYSNDHFNFTKKNKRLDMSINKNNIDYKKKDNTPKENDFTECGAIIMDKSCKYILLIKQRLSNKWGLPKGHMEKEEIEKNNILNCIKREINEETGINLNKINYNYIDMRYFYNNKYYNRVLFVFRINKDIKYINLNPWDLNEICDTKWIEIKYLKDFMCENNCNTSLRNIDIYNYIISYASVPYKKISQK